MAERRRGSNGGIAYQHPVAFWLGTTVVTVGVLLHLPMYFGAADMNYRLAGMPADLPMTIGMVLIVIGIATTVYGLFPRRSKMTRGPLSRIRVRALDDAPIRPAHVALLVVMAAAITIDVMKPTTLAFVAPGAAQEYGLKSPLTPDASGLPVALYALAGISGTAIGSFLWGWFGDLIGRRASILLSAVLFIATAVCGAMPDFLWNISTCFVMGLGVGGMLPIVFALMAETIPARHRGWLMVLIGGDVAGAYIITSWLASTIGAPDAFGWRMLWLVGLPTGVILIVLNRWIPESPRFLLQHGRGEEAAAIMKRYGAAVVEGEVSELGIEKNVQNRWSQLFATPFVGLSLAVILLGLGIGMVQYGFQQWIPSNLQRLGFAEVDASRILRDSALIGFPLNFLIAWAYGFWSARKTIILMAASTAAALFGFVAAGDAVVSNRPLLYVLLIVPIWGISSLTALVAAYAAEVYPTRIRSRGTGLAAGATKFGGVMILATVSAAIAAPSISITALIGAVPVALAVLAVLVFGVETRQRRLEQITADELGEEVPV
ncbi:MAG: MFS transporter [Actinomycetota bacterium]